MTLENFCALLRGTSTHQKKMPTSGLDPSFKHEDNVFTHNFFHFRSFQLVSQTLNNSPAVDLYVNWKILYMNRQAHLVRVGHKYIELF